MKKESFCFLFFIFFLTIIKVKLLFRIVLFLYICLQLLFWERSCLNDDHVGKCSRWWWVMGSTFPRNRNDDQTKNCFCCCCCCCCCCRHQTMMRAAAFWQHYCAAANRRAARRTRRVREWANRCWKPARILSSSERCLVIFPHLKIKRTSAAYKLLVMLTIESFFLCSHEDLTSPTFVSGRIKSATPITTPTVTLYGQKERRKRKEKKRTRKQLHVSHAWKELDRGMLKSVAVCHTGRCSR